MKYENKSDRMIIDHEGKFKGNTVDEFLNAFRQSKKNKYLLVQNRQILLDDEPVKNGMERIGNRKIVLLNGNEEIDWVQADTPCQKVYEDPFVLIVHKEPGIIIHGDPDDRDCLNARVAKYYADNDMHVSVRPIHRLDRDTEGLVIYSKNEFFQPWLDEQMEAKKIHRHYMAACEGKCEPGNIFTCSERLGRDRHNAGKYRVSSTGRDAFTKVTCIAEKGTYVLFGCDLETGRTHQIRVHLAYHGYPIVNDPLYGVESTDFPQMGLWADEIEFHSPITNKKHKIHDFEVTMFSCFE